MRLNLPPSMGCLPHNGRSFSDFRTQGGIFTTPGDAFTTPVEMWIKGLGEPLSSFPAAHAARMTQDLKMTKILVPFSNTRTLIPNLYLCPI